MRITCALLFVFGMVSLTAQNLTGKVVAADGSPIAFATIYIYETAQGMAADEKGDFQINIPPGNYTVEARSLGYESLIKKIVVATPGTSVPFQLVEKVQRLKEIMVSPSKEDPAYPVMRQAIAWAPYHLHQTDGYISDNYLKGSFKIESMPALMKMMIKDKQIKALVGRLLVLESQNHITYKAPSYYKQQVVAYKSSIPKDLEPKGGIKIVTSTIYTDRYDDYISPLSPKAFQYYRFRLADIYPSGKYQINKIQVTPKLKHAALFTGYLYIIENDWSIFAHDLSVTEAGTTVHYTVDYQEVRPSVFLPIIYNMTVDINMIGVKGFGRFHSSVKYGNIWLNPVVAKIQAKQDNEGTTPSTLTPKQKRVQETLEKLSKKEKLSTSEALKLARLSTQALEPEEIRKQRANPEIRDSSMVKIQVDSMASKRDSSYWKSVRTVPLLTEEASSFQRKDSLPSSDAIKTTDHSVEITLYNPYKKRGNLLKGGNIVIGDSSTLSYNGLLRGLLKEYNFANGFWLGQSLSFHLRMSHHRSLTFSPGAYYTTASKHVNWNISTGLRYAPRSNGQVSFDVGDYSHDIQESKGSSRFLNSIFSLLDGKNIIRFYQNQHIRSQTGIDLANGLRLTAGGGYEKRTLLVNKTSFHLFGQAPYPNAPDDEYAYNFPDNSITSGFLTLSYTPHNRYRIVNDSKINAESAYPTYEISFLSAFRSTNKAEQAEYNRIRLEIRQQIKLDEWSTLEYNASIGTLFNTTRLYAPDYYYFRTSPLFITFNNPANSFSLLPNYSSATGKWAEAHLTWQSDYLLLKRIGFLQRYFFSETLHVNFLYQNETAKPYTEAGYSIGFGNMLRAGIFTAFDRFDFRQAGIRINLSIFPTKRE